MVRFSLVFHYAINHLIPTRQMVLSVIMTEQEQRLRQYTMPHLSNFTFIGPYDTTGSSSNHGFSNRWRRSTHFQLNNSLLIGHRKAGFSLESAGTTVDYLTGGLSEFKNNIIAVYTKPYLVDSAGARAVTTVYPANPMLFWSIVQR